MPTLDETLKLVKDAQAKPLEASDIQKSITQATGLVSYDLQAPAKNLYPVLTPIRNKLPRVQGGGDTATRWKSVTAIAGSGYDSIGWVPEGQRSARMSITVEDKSATYKTLGEEDQVSYEAMRAGKGFEDVRATMVMRLLQKMMLKEEHALLGGNNSVALGTPTTPTVANADSGGTIADATYNVAVVALSYEGFRNSSVTGGVATSSTITGADGLTYVINGGSSAPSATASTGALTGGNDNVITATVPVVAGAVAYAWYVGLSGSEKLQSITTINSARFTALTTSHQALSAVTADKSKNTLGFDGLLYSAWASGSNAYIANLATGTPGTGTALTTNSAGGVAEIDTMLKTMWDNYQVSPSALFVSSQVLKSIMALILNASSAPLLRYNSNGDAYAITANGTIEAYFNPYATNGGYKVPVLLHPFMPAGTLYGYVGDLPAQYSSNNVPNVAEVHVGRDYYQIDWPIKTRQQEVGVYAEETLAVYAPFAQGIITNIAP